MVKIIRSRKKNNVAQIVRRRPQKIEIKRSIESHSILRKKMSGRPMRLSVMCKRIWKASKKDCFNNPEELERAIRASGVCMIPDEPSEKMAVAAILHNKSVSKPEDLIFRYGKSYLNTLIGLWKIKLKVVFDAARSENN